VFHAIARVKQASIKDALVVAGRDHMGDVMELPGGGHDFGLDFTCEVQNQAGGIAQAQRTGARPTISSVPDRLGHDRTCAMNIGRLHETGWHPQEETALFPKTVEWLLRASGAGANDDH
jgi:dTDP-D-glucose 4,6-dehydratase